MSSDKKPPTVTEPIPASVSSSSSSNLRHFSCLVATNEESPKKELASSAVQKKLVPVKKERKLAASPPQDTPPVTDIEIGTPKGQVKKEFVLQSSFQPESSQESTPGSCDNPYVINDNDSDDSSFAVDMMTSTNYQDQDPSKNFVIEVDGKPHVLISGKPFPKKLIDDLDDDVSAVALYPNGDVTTVYRNELIHERRVRRLNKKLSKKIWSSYIMSGTGSTPYPLSTGT